MSVEESINRTKSRFEKSFKEGTLYDRQTQSQEHIEKILGALDIRQGSIILDLGTGSGYLAFAIAEANKDCRVIGLDIVEEALEQNRKKAKAQHLDNISFVTYDGINFPFQDGTFDYVTTRYALHHFPEIQNSFMEIARVLSREGKLFLADPTPNADDTEGFADDYMGMKKDGHIKYYTEREFITYAESVYMELVNSFYTEICFPRLKETAEGFDEIMKRHNKQVTEGYKVYVTEDDQYIYITQNVLNLVFEKNRK